MDASSARIAHETGGGVASLGLETIRKSEQRADQKMPCLETLSGNGALEEHEMPITFVMATQRGVWPVRKN